MKFRHLLKAPVVAALLLPALYGGTASSQVFFSSSSTCAPAVTAVTYTGTTPTAVHICGTLPATQFFCGQTLQLRAANAGESGKFSVTGRTAVAPFNAAPYTDAATTLPQVIGNPAPTADLGASSTGASGYAPAAAPNSTRLLTSLQITADSTATNSSYVLSFDPNSFYASADDSICSTNYSGVAPSATLTMNKAIAPATAAFTIATPVNVTEGGATANAVVTCTGALDSNNTAITVPFTAVTGGNFTTSASPLTFTSCGGATQNIVVTPRAQDTTVQGATSGTITLNTPSAGSLGAAATATVNVADNDALPSVSITTAGACAEPATNCTFTVTATSNTTPAQTGAGPSVPFTISGTATNNTDYKLVLGASCAAAAFTGPIATTYGTPSVMTVCVLDDVIQEGAENVTVTLTPNAAQYSLTTASATQSIADDDSPQVVTVAVSAPVSEAGGVLTYTFTRSGGSAAAQAAALAVNITPPPASSRYTNSCTSPITFPASSPTPALTVTCTVTAVDNTAVDGNVNVPVTVAAPTVAGAYTVGSPATATGVINDDEVAVNAVAGNTGSAASLGITEGGIARFSVSCPTLTTPFTVNYSISPATPATGDAFVGGVATGSVTCPAAAASLVAVPTTVQTIDDTVVGNSRTYTMTISVPTLPPAPAPAATVIGNAVAVVTVADNDQPKSVPTLGAVGVGLMSLMLAGLVAFQRRRRA